MKLEELVPPLELCKLIPKGEFEDSALMWVEDVHPTLTPFVEPRRYVILEDEEIPAPTLEEIMAELPSCVCYRMNEEWSVGLVNDSAENAIKDSSGAADALKLWLELKGIDYGK